MYVLYKTKRLSTPERLIKILVHYSWEQRVSRDSSQPWTNPNDCRRGRSNDEVSKGTVDIPVEGRSVCEWYRWTTTRVDDVLSGTVSVGPRRRSRRRQGWMVYRRGHGTRRQGDSVCLFNKSPNGF